MTPSSTESGAAVAPKLASGRPVAVHPLLQRAFAALDRSGHPWLVLRGFDDLEAPSGDVDLLVAETALPELEPALAAEGLHRVTAAGRGSHRFYFGFDLPSSLWLKLDVVTDLAFGEFQQWTTPFAAKVLDRRIRRDGLPMPAPGDQGLLELIHLVLDKGGLPVGREQAARRAAEVADPSSDLARDLDARAGGAIDRLVQAAARGDIAEFGTLSQEMRLGLDRSAPARIRCTVLANRLRRRRRPRLASAHRAGIAVGVMGPDGAGKTTLLHAVAQGFPLPASYVYLGLWADGTWDRWLHRLPGGRLGQRVGRLLRGSLVARVQRARGRLVLIDRLAHDALLPGAVDDSLGGQITRALAARIGPKVDVVFVLDAPAALMYARKREHSPEVLDKWRRSYLELARRLPEAVVIDASCPADEVRAQAVHLLWCRIVRVESRRADSSATELGAA